MELARKKRFVKHSSKVNVWSRFSSQGYARIICFKQSINAELMCDIYKRGLMPTTKKQFSLDSTIWELQEDKDLRHIWKLAIYWKANDRIKKLDCPPMLPDLTPIENVWQPLKMKLRKKI